MFSRSILIITFLLIAVLSAPAELSFNRDIRPILSDKCFSCHGTDAKHRKGALRLDVPEAAYAKGDSGALAIVPGKPLQSEVWVRICLDDSDDDHMPPLKTKKPLSPAERTTLKTWIEQGASYQRHWAFEPPVAKLPLGKDGSEIDAFIDAKLRDTGLKPAPEADRHVLIRRAAFAITGLPPSAEALDAFLSDTKAGAYERMIDRYMATDQYGEEMARHWLDVARYADTHGMHLDNERQMYAYRDWVIGAFNRNQPFDQFTIEQIAGDLLPTARNDQLVATGFNRCNITTGEGGSIKEEFIFRYAVERASTTAEAWLGLSAGCAVCHDHKFDPITAVDFYSFYAFFHSSADPAMDGNKLLTAPVVKVVPADYDETDAGFARRIADIEADMDKRAATLTYADPADMTPPPAVVQTEQVWFEDAFPAGAQTGSTGPLTFSNESEPVFSGTRSLKRSGPGLAQDYYSMGASPFVVPSNATFFVHVYIDPADLPKAIMIQFHSSGWSHRAFWGENVIPWGKEGTGERYAAGALPESAQWVRLDVPAESMNLAQGTEISGYAFTVQDGTVYFDKMGVSGSVDPSKDPGQSFAAWRRAAEGTSTPGVPETIGTWLKQGPEQVRTPEELDALKAYYLRAVCDATKPQFAESIVALATLQKEREDYQATFPSTFIWKDLATPRDSYVMVRGEYDKPGEKVVPNTPAMLPPLKKSDPDGRATRLDLARWLVDRDNPLTARVTVNRFWQQLFGVGLVKTSHDLGTQGEIPSHPDLLDWLAVRFQDDGWDVKKLMKRMLVSDAFRRSSSAPADLWQRDPENRLLARGPRMRLDAEQLRDSALFAGGLLKMQMGGKGVKTYQPPNIWEPVGFRGSNTSTYKRDNGDALYRRSIYTFLKRTAPAPFMANFDAPNREQSCARRERSNTPLQALQLMNDVQYFEAARGLATRMMQATPDTAERVAFAYRALLSRTPTREEFALVEALYNQTLEKYQTSPAEAHAAIGFGDSPAPEELDASELAAWSAVASLVFNLDESIVRN